MDKDFENWNYLKQKINERKRILYAHPREVWWCSLGINIGAEIDGKNENFERPVIIMKVYSKESMIVLPLTTKEKNDSFHHRLEMAERIVWVKLTQTRVISTKRLFRKVDVLDKNSFEILKNTWKQSL